MPEDDARSPGSSELRGWLSDVYLPALIEGQVVALMHRLGGRATIDDPIFGRTSGLPTLEAYVAEMSEWLRKRGAKYERLCFATGTDRDVTEGKLTITLDGKAVDLPIAIVAERRPSREVELRLYYTTAPINGKPALRSPVVGRDDELLLAPTIVNHLAALAHADLDALVASFESGGAIRDSRGVTHAKDANAGGELRAFYAKLLGATGVDGGVKVLKGGKADDGRICALEYTVVKIRGSVVPPQAGLAVYDRSDTGLLRAVRIYEDVHL
jgi:hypothetical protein